MSTVLVTGVAGFILSHVADHLLRAGHTVIGLDDLSGGFLENIPDGVEFVRGSVTNARRVDWIFHEKRPDYVLHGAAYAAEGLSHFIKRFNYTNNLIGSTNLINAAVNHGCKGFVFLSSMAVYGAQAVPFVETQTPRPEDSYGIAKYAVEQELRISHEMFGLPFVIFRPHNVIGPRQHLGDAYRNVVGIFMNQCMRGEAMSIFGNGEQTRAFSDIDDVAPLMAASIDTPQAWGDTFNIGADTPWTINALSREVATAMGVPHRVVHLPAREEVREAYSDHARLRQVFGTRKPIPLAVALAKMAAWARARGPQETHPFPAIEIRQHLPEKWR